MSNYLINLGCVTTSLWSLNLSTAEKFMKQLLINLEALFHDFHRLGRTALFFFERSGYSALH